jgi:hypothetical protein
VLADDTVRGHLDHAALVFAAPAAQPVFDEKTPPIADANVGQGGGQS